MRLTTKKMRTRSLLLSLLFLLNGVHEDWKAVKNNVDIYGCILFQIMDLFGFVSSVDCAGNGFESRVSKQQ